jgi:hypothetical protein
MSARRLRYAPIAATKSPWLLCSPSTAPVEVTNPLVPLLCQASVAISGFQRVHGMTVGESPTMALVGLLDGGRGGIAGSDGGGDAASWVL